ncbi:MAG: hypothetical protein ACREMF_05915 [Gemmatimonadales bacterium]
MDSSRPRRSPLAFSAAVVVSGLACIGTSSEPTPPDIAGTWNYTETLIDRLNQATCVDTGLYDLTQVGDSFAGTYRQTGVCTTPQGAFDNSSGGRVESGHILGLNIAFHVPQDCDYEGTLAGSPPNFVAGKGYCVGRNPDGSSFNYEGQWEATR